MKPSPHLEGEKSTSGKGEKGDRRASKEEKRQKGEGTQFEDARFPSAKNNLISRKNEDNGPDLRR